MTIQILAPLTENEQPRTGVLFTPERAAQIVAGWREDPIDIWRKRQKKYDRVWRSRSTFGRHASEKPKELPPHMALAQGAVERVAARLVALGYTVELSRPNTSWDLLVEGCLRVEVKASAWREQKPDKARRLPRHRYQANIRAGQAKAIDLVIFVAINGSDHHFIIPREQLNGRHSLTIRSQDPVAYTGCLAEFRERWELIAASLDAARTREA